MKQPGIFSSTAQHMSPLRRLCAAAIAVAMLGSGLVAAGISPAYADDPIEYTEAHTFESPDGKAQGYSSDMVGDYVAYTDILHERVAVQHRSGPNADDWETQTLSRPAGSGPLGFGTAIVLNDDATALFVSSPKDEKIYRYDRNGANSWNYVSAMAPPALPTRVSTLNGTLGEALAIDGDTLAVGVPNARVDNKVNAGFGYAVKISTNTWDPLIPSDPLFYSITGQTIAVSDNRVALSATQNKDAANNQIGGVYLWDLNNLSAEPAFATQPDGPHLCLSSPGGPAFGYGLSFAENGIFVGAPTEINFTSDDPADPLNGCNLSSVQDGTTTQGAVYEFDNTLQQVAPKLLPPAHTTAFGVSVVSDGNAMIVSAERVPGYRGQVHVYDLTSIQRSGSTGDADNRQSVDPVQTLLPAVSADFDSFGQGGYGAGVRLSGTHALIASPGARDDKGTVYLYEPILPNVVADVTVAPAASRYGDKATLTATVGGAVASGGTVEFVVNGESAGSAAVTAGVGTLVIPFATKPYTAGSHAIVAHYSDGVSPTPVATGSGTLAVSKAKTTATFNAAPPTNTPGSTLALTGKVIGEYGTIPTGKARIVDAAGTLVAEVVLNTKGEFTSQVTIPAKAASGYALTVNYVGDANHEGSSSKASTVTSKGTAPVITTKSLPIGYLKKAYTATVTATGNEAPKFSVSSGSLPKGLKLDAATGKISGTPEVKGSFVFKITAKNSVGSDTKQFTLKVDPKKVYAGVCAAPRHVPVFADTPLAHKFYKEIDWMHCMKYSTGWRQPAGKPLYKPQDNLQRAAMAAFIFRMEAPKNYKAPKVSPFADVRPGDSFYREIAWMYEEGLSTGWYDPAGKPTFRPWEHLSREAMAAFIFRLEAPKTYKAPAVSPMVDMKKGMKFYREVSWMYDEGLSTGNKTPRGKEYWPKDKLSRQAMAAFIYRLVTDYRINK